MYLFFDEWAIYQRWSAVFCATGAWGGKPIGRVRGKQFFYTNLNFLINPSSTTTTTTNTKRITTTKTLVPPTTTPGIVANLDSFPIWTPDELDEIFAEYKDQAENDGMVYTGIINSFQLEEYGCACRQVLTRKFESKLNFHTIQLIYESNLKHCERGLNLGAKPVGKPVDAVDSACLRWKRCMNCAQSSIGQVCGGYRITRQNTCGKEIYIDHIKQKFRPSYRINC